MPLSSPQRKHNATLQLRAPSEKEASRQLQAVVGQPIKFTSEIPWLW